MTGASRKARMACGLSIALALVPFAGRCTDPPATATAPAPLAAAASVADAPAPAGDATATATPATRNGLDIYARFHEGLADPRCPVDSSSARWRKHFAHAPERFGERDDDTLALFGYVVDALREASLPTEYALIPFVESGYDPSARSKGGPAGMWQMARVTARAHGVPMRPGYDGRLSPVESTRAAVRYLKTLHGMFAGDWRLAVMAYNAGEYRVFGALRRAHQVARDADPSKLASLSGITRAYVRKLHALSCLLDRADDREAWMHALDRPIPVLEAVALPAGARDLGRWAKSDGRDAAMVRRLNPALAGGRIAARAHRTLRVLAPMRPAPALPGTGPAPEPGTAPAPDATLEIASVPVTDDAMMPASVAAPDTPPHVPTDAFPASASGPAPATQAH
jgi:membrane-bound lytic murein transglycosylase D